MSGGTIIALSCKEILMGKQSSIGPVDPLFGDISAVGLIDEIQWMSKEIKRDAANALIWDPILRQISPGFITECKDAIRWSHKMATDLLKSNMFKNHRNKNQRVSKIIAHLSEKKTTMNHGRHIGLDEAKSLFGDKLVEIEGDNKLQDLILSIHHAAIITLHATDCYKIIENHAGRAFLQRFRALPT